MPEPNSHCIKVKQKVLTKFFSAYPAREFAGEELQKMVENP